MSDAKIILDFEQVEHELSIIDEEYEDARVVNIERRNTKLEALKGRCPPAVYARIAMLQDW